jgi:hypothetical protein
VGYGTRWQDMLRAVIVPIIMLWLCGQSRAESGIIGAGGLSCAKLGDMYKRNFTSAEEYTTMYVQGYLSGLNDAQAMAENAAAMRNLDVPMPTTMNAVRLACDQRPMAQLFGIIGDYWRTLPLARIKPQ